MNNSRHSFFLKIIAIELFISVQRIMLKATTIKEALRRWEQKNDSAAVDAKDIQLQFQWPPIEKMDSTLSSLINCEKLCLSTNMIDKIVGLNGMKNLRILSLARNNIKSLNGLEALADTLEELWISYNQIDRVKGIEMLKCLRVLYIGNNSIRDWTELSKLNVVTTLEDLLFYGNPVMESMDDEAYRREITKRLPKLKKLDGITILRTVD